MRDLVRVVQADRDAVQAFHRLRLNKLMEAIKDEKAGARLGEDEGDAGDLVQAFARHRLAHSEPRPVAGEVLEALELADALLRGANMDRAVVERKVTAAIASLSNTRDVSPSASDLPEAAQRLLTAMTTRALRGRDHVPSMRDEQDAAKALSAALATHSPAPTEAGEGWQQIESAPYDQEVIVRVYGMTFHAKLLADVSMDDDEQPCDQWQATRDGEHPPCWSEGGCWSSNENGDPSMQPDAWKPATSTQGGAEG